MKTWKLALLSFVAGLVLSVAPIVTYACASTIYVQDADDCNSYTRYVLVGTGGDAEVQICAYQDSGGSKHRESGHCEDLPVVM